MQGDGENDSGEYDISVVTYNILADFHLQQSLSKESSTYKNCSQEYVKPKQDRSCPRHKLLLTEVTCFLEKSKCSKIGTGVVANLGEPPSPQSQGPRIFVSPPTLIN